MTRMRRLGAACAATWLVGLTGCATPAPTPAVEPGLTAIATVSGRGRPVVVLQSGLGDGQAVWEDLVPLIETTNTVFRYDRPGRGQHPFTGAPRAPCTIAAEQRALLQRAGLPPPYILVGHSLGGLYQFAYLRLYPDEVAAVVLIDPTHPDHWRSLQREHPDLALLMKGVRMTLFSQAERSEFDAQSLCLDQLPPPVGRVIPTTLLASGQRRPEEQAMVPMLDRLRQDWLHLIPGALLQTVPDAGHYVQRERPRRVADALRALQRQ
jgi:pimeloyl-ACP methyl ester carboxylesterase